jgi:hypothetical protein
VSDLKYENGNSILTPSTELKDIELRLSIPDIARRSYFLIESME